MGSAAVKVAGQRAARRSDPRGGRALLRHGPCRRAEGLQPTDLSLSTETVHHLSSTEDQRLAAEAGSRRQQPAPEAEQRCRRQLLRREEKKSRSSEGSVERFWKPLTDRSGAEEVPADNYLSKLWRLGKTVTCEAS